MTEQEKKRIIWLEALEAAGVDNWEGIDEAVDIYQEMLKEINDQAPCDS